MYNMSEKKTQKPTKQHSKFNTNYSNECKFCGKKHKPNKKLCPAYGKACSNCRIKKPLCLQMQKNKRQKEQKGTPNR